MTALNNPPNSFQHVSQIVHEQGVQPALDFLEQQFREQKLFFQLFEIRKMQVRNRIGLPLIYGQQPDELDESQQRQLEDGLLDVCLEVGRLLVEDGRLEEGWMYLQPVGDRQQVEEIIRAIPVSKENVDTIVEVAFSRGAAPVYGYGLLMQHFGTCNAITAFDTQAAQMDRPTQKAMAELLLRHLYTELCANLLHIVEREGKSATDSKSLSKLLAEHPWLIEGGAHHIDATHLASVMRIARAVDQSEDLQIALELANYGNGLHSDFQYPSPPPFEATYPDHQFFYAALLGQDVELAIKHFESKCQSVDPAQYGSVAYETLVDLLVRLERSQSAIELLTKHVLGKFEPMGIAPQIFQIAHTPSELKMVRDYFREHDDLLNFSISVFQALEPKNDLL